MSSFSQRRGFELTIDPNAESLPNQPLSGQKTVPASEALSNASFAADRNTPATEGQNQIMKEVHNNFLLLILFMEVKI